MSLVRTSGAGGEGDNIAPLYRIEVNGWAYLEMNTGTPDVPVRGDWRAQKQAHPTIVGNTMVVHERFGDDWEVIKSDGLGSVASNGFTIWDGSEGFNYANSDTPTQTLINIAPGLDGATVGSTTGNTAIISHGTPYALHTARTATLDVPQPLGLELYTLTYLDSLRSYGYIFEITESETTIEDSVSIYVDETSDLSLNPTIRVGNLLPDSRLSIQNVSKDEFIAKMAPLATHGVNTLSWKREYPVQKGVVHYGFIQSEVPLVIRGATLGEVFIPQFSRYLYKSELLPLAVASTSFVNSDIDLAVGRTYCVDTTAGTCTLTEEDSDFSASFSVIDSAENFAVNSCFVVVGGNTYEMDKKNKQYDFWKTDDSWHWSEMKRRVK